MLSDEYFDDATLQSCLEIIKLKEEENLKLTSELQILQSYISEQRLQLNEKDSYIQELEEGMEELAQELDGAQKKNIELLQEKQQLQEKVVEVQISLKSMKEERNTIERQAEIELSRLIQLLESVEKQCKEQQEYIAVSDELLNDQESKILDLLSLIRSVEENKFTTPERGRLFEIEGEVKEEPGSPEVENLAARTFSRQKSGSEDEDGLPSPVTLKINRNLTKQRSAHTPSNYQKTNSNPGSWEKAGKPKHAIFESISVFNNDDNDDERLIVKDSTKDKDGVNLEISKEVEVEKEDSPEVSFVEEFEQPVLESFDDSWTPRKNTWKEASRKYEDIRPPAPPFSAEKIINFNKTNVEKGRMINVRSTAVPRLPAALPPPSLPPPPPPSTTTRFN